MFNRLWFFEHWFSFDEVSTDPEWNQIWSFNTDSAEGHADVDCLCLLGQDGVELKQVAGSFQLHIPGQSLRLKLDKGLELTCFEDDPQHTESSLSQVKQLVDVLRRTRDPLSDPIDRQFYPIDSLVG